MEGVNYADALARLLTATKSKTETELAAALGVKPQSVSQTKQKRHIPPRWFLKIALKYGVSVDWLMTGRDFVMSGADIGDKGDSARCIKLEKELERERESSRRKDAAILDGLKKLEENGELRLKNMKLQMELDTARKMCEEYHAENAELKARLSLSASEGNAGQQSAAG